MKLKINPYMLAFLALVCLAFHVADAVAPASAGGACPLQPRPPHIIYGKGEEEAAFPRGFTVGHTVASGVVAPYVDVISSDGGGSGVALRVGGEVLVLTAAHVVGDWVDAVEIRRPQAEEGRQGWQKAKVVRKSAPDEFGGLDLALLRPEKPEWLVPAYLAPKGSRLRPGEDAWYCGSGGGIPGNLEKTIINRTGYDAGGSRWTLVNGNGWYGHSGSGVYIRRGGNFYLVGVVLRLRVGYPKSPLLCRELEDIHKFLDGPGGKGPKK